uniref:Adherens junctions associated protein 1 n=1 Tax=Phasianus colchicus TaxID=9054 RepID=A0A669R6N5_PHACC
MSIKEKRPSLRLEEMRRRGHRTEAQRQEQKLWGRAAPARTAGGGSSCGPGSREGWDGVGWDGMGCAGASAPPAAVGAPPLGLAPHPLPPLVGKPHPGGGSSRGDGAAAARGAGRSGCAQRGRGERSGSGGRWVCNGSPRTERSAFSMRRSGCPLGSHAWMLIAMFHLAMDLASCEPAGTRLSPRSAQRHRLPRGVLWSTGGSEEPRRPSPPWPCAPRARRPPPVPLPRARRQLRGRGFAPRDGRPTALPEVIVWGPTGEEDSLESSTLPSIFTTAATTTITTTTAATTAATTVATVPTPSSPAPTPGIEEPRGRPSTSEPAAGHSSGGKDARPPRGLGDTAGLAVHQIITITVSLIMVIAALITTLVLKNCCAQSGAARRNGHQRKITQQEESCQNLTDFTPARVPSSLDIFTAYNETLQCSHECVRTPVPVYTEEALHSPGDYKATFNGNRPSSSDRHLIPVAFVSEKWFEISC